MPQWRKLHVKVTESLDLNDMPDDFTRLLWVLLPLGADREGRGLDNGGWIKAKAMPLRMDVTHAMIEDAMAWYAERGMVRRYEVDGRAYFDITNFSKYQGNNTKEAESNYPPAPELLQTYSRPTPDLLRRNSGTDVDVDVDVERDSLPKNGSAPADEPKTSEKPPEEPRPLTPAQIARDELVAYFCEFSKIPLPEWKTKSDFKTAQKLWWTPINEMLRWVDGDVERAYPLIWMSVERMRKDGLTLSNPCSIEKTAASIYAELQTRSEHNGR
jgi:hypothetical protein